MSIDGMNYIDALARNIFDRTLRDGEPKEMTPEDARLYRIYAVLALAKGRETTSRDVHDAWSAWRADTMPEHRSLIPFEDLAPNVQDYDDAYRDAIHAVAGGRS